MSQHVCPSNDDQDIDMSIQLLILGNKTKQWKLSLVYLHVS